MPPPPMSKSRTPSLLTWCALLVFGLLLLRITSPVSSSTQGPTMNPLTDDVDKQRTLVPSVMPTSTAVTLTTGDSHVIGVRRLDKFLVIGNAFGRHSNQMVSITAAMALGEQTKRIVVLPDLMFGGKGGGGSVAAEPGSVYSLTPDWREADGVMCVNNGGGCVITSSAFVALVGSTELQAGCVGMRGVSATPRVPRGVPQLKCAATSFAKFKKQLATVRASIDQLASHRIVYIPLVMYLAWPLEPQTSFAWRLFAPSPEIAAYTAALRVAQQRACGEQHLTTVGVHLRNLEGSCSSRVDQFWTDAFGIPPAAGEKNQIAALKRQCEMDPTYVKSFFGKDTCTSMYLADDGQRATWRTSIEEALSSPVWALHRALSKEEGGTPLGKVATALAERRVEDVTRIVAGDVSSFYRTGPPSEVKAITTMLMDFWSLVAMDVFVGNQMSTLSVNVCRRRRAVDKPCNNFVSKHT